MKKDFSIRLAVGDPHGRRSVIWKIYSTNDEVYALHRSMGKIEKISFHSSPSSPLPICRLAFLDKTLPPIERWERAETPSAGEMKAVSVLMIFFSEGHLSPNLPTEIAKPVIWLDAPPVGAVRIVQVLFSNDTEADVLRLIQDAGQQLVLHHRLPNGEGVGIRSWTNPWEQADLIVPASHHTTEDIIFPAAYQAGNARTVALTMNVRRDELRCFEYTGFRVPAGEARRRFPQADTLSRSEVLQRGTRSS
jgi:hypothetical protein